MCDKPEKVSSSLNCKGELGQAPDISEGNLKPYLEEVTASVAREGQPTKSGYLTFDSGGISTINWWPNQGQVSEYIRSTRVNPSSDRSKKPTGLSNTPLSEEYWYRLNRTPILGESHLTRGSKRLNQTDISAVNIDKSPSITSVKGRDPAEASSETLHLHP